MRQFIFIATFLSFVFSNSYLTDCCNELVVENEQKVESSHCAHHKSSKEKEKPPKHKKDHKNCKTFCCMNYISTTKLVKLQHNFLFSLDLIRSNTISPINNSDVLLRPPIILS
jgi:hypothetical protein